MRSGLVMAIAMVMLCGSAVVVDAADVQDFAAVEKYSV